MPIIQKSTSACQECTILVDTTATIIGNVTSFKIGDNDNFHTRVTVTATSQTNTMKKLVDELLKSLPYGTYATRSQSTSENSVSHRYFTLYTLFIDVPWQVSVDGMSRTTIESFVPKGLDWATSATDRLLPDLSKQTTGFLTKEMPNRQWLNWLFNISSNCASGLATMSMFVRDRITKADQAFIGEVKAYGGKSSTIPYGYSICDGSVIPTDAKYNSYRDWAYANQLASLYPSGVSGPYITPDMVGRNAVGAGLSPTLGNYFTLLTPGGEVYHTLTKGELPEHSHTYTTPGASRQASGNDSGYASATTGTGLTGTGDVNGLPHNNMPPYLPLTYIIRTYF